MLEGARQMILENENVKTAVDMTVSALLAQPQEEDGRQIIEGENLNRLVANLEDVLADVNIRPLFEYIVEQENIE